MSEGYPQFEAPNYGSPPLSDQQLRQLPPPVVPRPATAVAPAGSVPRPAVIALGATLAVTASLQWICALGLAWVTATVGAGELSSSGSNGGLFHILERFNYRLLDGLAWPLFLFPLGSLVTGFLVLRQEPWTRIAHTVLGLAALGWSAWWLRDNLAWWASAALYIGTAVAVVWTPAATRWYSDRDPSAG